MFLTCGFLTDKSKTKSPFTIFKKKSKVPVFQERKAISLRLRVLDRNLISYPRSKYPKPHLAYFLVPTGTFEPIYRIEPYFDQGLGSCPVCKPVRFDKPARKYTWVPEMCGAATFNSPFRARNTERRSDSSSPQNLGSLVQNFGSRGIYTQR